MFQFYREPMVRFVTWLAAVLLAVQVGLETFIGEHVRPGNMLTAGSFLVLWVLIIDFELRIKRERRRGSGS